MDRYFEVLCEDAGWRVGVLAPMWIMAKMTGGDHEDCDVAIQRDCQREYHVTQRQEWYVAILEDTLIWQFTE